MVLHTSARVAGRDCGPIALGRTLQVVNVRRGVRSAVNIFQRNSVILIQERLLKV